MNSTTRKQIRPDAKPIISAAIGVTKPAAGVMPTRPATAPAVAPSTLGRSCRIQLAVIQVSVAIAAAELVVTNALTASAPEPSALPALKPNQPNHSSAVPSTVIVALCGAIDSWP